MKLKYIKGFKFLLLPLILITISIIVSTIVYSLNYEGMEIKEIKFEGNLNTSVTTLKAAVKLRKNGKYSTKKVRESIKELWDLQNFKDIKVDAKKVGDSLIVTFILSERAFIKDIEFTGHDKLNKTTLEEAIKDIIVKDAVLSEAKINDAKFAILEKYNEDGYFDVSIDPEITELKENKVKILFQIEEGIVTKVSEIRIKGSKVFEEKKLKRKMETKEDKWYNKGIFKEEEYAEDKETLIKYYKDRGYIKAHIVSDDITYEIEEKPSRRKRKPSKKKKKMIINLEIFEGDQYKFSGYEVEGNTLFETEFIEKGLSAKTNKIYEQKVFEKDMASIQQKYADRGYIFAHIDPNPIFDDDNKRVTFKLVIYEGEIAHVEKIILKGNTKTKDYVVLRELSIEEGEIFVASKVRRSQEKIYNLGFFKDVKFDVKPGSAEGLMNLIIDVEEQQTGMITLGAVFGSVDGFGGYEEISENNLGGRGYRIHERIEWQARKQHYEVGFRTPWIAKKPISMDFRIYYIDRLQQLRVRDYNGNGISDYKERMYDSNGDGVGDGELFGTNIPMSYLSTNSSNGNVIGTNKSDENEHLNVKLRRIGFSLGNGWRFNDYNNFNIINSIEAYQYHNMEYLKVPEQLRLYHEVDPEPHIKKRGKDEGKKFSRTRWQSTYKLDFIYRYDSRDNVFNATKGQMFEQGIQFVWGFGNYTRYIKYSTDYSFYFNTFWKFVFVFHWNMKFIGNPFDRGNYYPPEPEDRLYLGGTGGENIRGWSMDSSLAGWGSRGRATIYYNLEFRFPIWEKMFWGVFFFDAGNLWAMPHQIKFHPKHYKYAMGFGVRVHIPMLPLRFYVSRPFYRNPKDELWYFANDKEYWEGRRKKGEWNYWRNWYFNISVGGFF